MKRRSSLPLLLAGVSLSIVLVLCILDKGFLLPILSVSPMTTAVPAGFVKRFGSQLMLNGSPFHFAGANMHWLALDDPTTYPSQFRVNDGLDAAKEMGLTVIRSHSLGISTGCSNCIEPELGVFNETAFKHVDYAIKAARDRGLRLIIPLTDNWHYPTGGKHNFTDWRGITDENQFYYNPQVIRDFEAYISTLLNHVNIYTGLAYKNDPTIMAWETGNELDPPATWTQTISRYIKSIDRNQLVMDGRTGIDLHAASLVNVDILSNHYYPKSVSVLENDASLAKRAGKAFIVGEFDWNDANGGDRLTNFLAAIASNPAVAGDAFWELWSHDDEYGYVSNDPQYTFHYPGDSAAMRADAGLLRIHAYTMRGEPAPADSPPGVPQIGVVIRGGPHDVIIWRGAALATNYTIERSTSSASGPWAVICDKCATDMSTPWTDTTTPRGALWYRVIAHNVLGVAGNPSSPYQAGSGSMIVDNLDDWSKTYQHSRNLILDTTYSEHMHGDQSRIIRMTATHEYIIWKQARMTSFQAIAYFWPYEAVSHFSLYTSFDGEHWIPTDSAITSINGDWIEYIYTLQGLSGVNYVKMVWNNTSGLAWNPNLGEVSITY
ncbi:MAG TPA: cellulase family glycosylhydrolase [Ktedonobacteraceae bacterium]|nr:cellulase family glycosylhydrolase [Ktedonobacteraceae bacterium]